MDMGSGKTIVSAYYGVQRKIELSEKAIARTAQVYGIRLEDKLPPRLKPVTAKKWEETTGKTQTEAAAVYVKWKNTMYIQKEFFAGPKAQKTVTHEYLHHHAGTKIYGSSGSLGHTLEEGIVEYFAQGTRKWGYRGRGKRYAKGWRSYQDQVDQVTLLMSIVGRKKVLKLWNKGFAVVHKTPRMKQLEKERDAAHKGKDWVRMNDAALAYDRLEERNYGYEKLARALERKGYEGMGKEIRTKYRTEEKVDLFKVYDQDLVKYPKARKHIITWIAPEDRES